MDNIYHSELWRDLYVMLGTSAGALVGLLFVVMSLHIEKVDNPDYNLSMTIQGSRNNTYHLLTVLVEAALVLMPQPLTILGAELFAINLFGLRLPLIISCKLYGRNITIGNRSGFPVALILTIVVGYLLGIAGGIVLVQNDERGLYLVTLCCVTLIVRSVLTAWTFMFGARRANSEKREN
ncbi:MAG: hypothetical protein DVB25_05075 [Verrucomicrobia bacterium]|nr:MAG: hypothetical protein DVB25_05075 [Verrucomicrobiota bacterium]